MPDVDTPDPEHRTTPDEIESWPSGRTPDELPQTGPSPVTPDPQDQPDAPVTPAEAGDALGQPSGGSTAAS